MTKKLKKGTVLTRALVRAMESGKLQTFSGVAVYKKPYPKRINLTKKIFLIIGHELKWILDNIKEGRAVYPGTMIGIASRQIAKFVGNNYRRRRH